MTEVSGRFLPDLNRGTVRSAVATSLDHLLDADRLPDEGVIVVPDVHYPFHPSTGLVTNPIVVDAVIDELRDVTGAPVALGVASPNGSGPQIAEWISYRDVLDRHDIEMVDLREVTSEEHTAAPGDEPVRVSVPKPLANRAVIGVPTIRSDPEFGLVAATANLALACGKTVPSSGMAAAVAVVDPVVSLADGTYTYVGEARASRFLLAGGRGDHQTVDRVLSAAADGIDTPPYLVSDDTVTGRITLRGVMLDELRESLPETSPRDGGQVETNPMMRAGYKLYTRLSGDLLPPSVVDDD